MTVGSTTVVTSGSNTNGATTTFSFSFRVQDYGAVEAEDQIRVTLYNVSAGTSSVLTRGTSAGQYSVSINGDQDSSPGGSITTVTTYASGYKVYIELAPSFLQATDYVNQGGFLAATVESQHDQQQMQINVLADKLRRSPVAGVQLGSSFSGEISGAAAVGAIPQLNSSLTGFEWVVNNGSSNIVTANDGGTHTLAEWFAGMSRGATPPDSSYGYFSDRATNGDLANPIRIRDRLFVGAGADESASFFPGGTWVSSTFSPYLVWGSQSIFLSPSGGAGATFGTRRSDVYDGNPLWTTGEAVTAGAKRGNITSAGGQALYTAQNSGTTGATPPTHTTGTVSDGTVNWTFTQLQYRTAMGFVSVGYNNVGDGGGLWGGYIEVYRGAGGGYTHGLEIDVKNGGSSVQVNPYSINTAGATDALNLAAGPTDYGPSSSNPVSAAILFQSNGSATFHKGLVFESTSLTDEGGGVYIAMALAQGMRIRQYTPAGANGGYLSFDVSATNERTAQNFADRRINFYCQGAVMGAITSAPAAGTAPDEYLALVAQAAGTTYATLQAAGTATDIGIRLSPKGSGKVYVPGAWRTIAASAVAVTRNSVNGAGDATETTGATITIPAGEVGANGIIRVTFLGSCTNSANVKTWRIRLGGLSGTAFYNLAATNQATTQVQLLIRNRNSASSQIGYPNTVAAGLGQTTAAATTAAINTANAQDIVITTAWAGATSAESMTIEAYQVEVFYQA